jgi:DNA gyrase subunit A
MPKKARRSDNRLQGCGGSGVINVKTAERNDKVVGIAQVTEDSEVMLISQYGKIIRIFEHDSRSIRLTTGSRHNKARLTSDSSRN